MSLNVSLEGMSQEEISSLAMIAKSLGDNPETRQGMQKLMKQADPSLRIPEIDIPVQFQTQLEAERNERMALQKRLDDEALERRIREQRQVIQSKGIPADKVGEVEALMVSKGIANHETAAEFYLAQQRMATPTAPEGRKTFMSFSLPNFKGSKSENRAATKNAAAQMWDDMTAGKLAAE